MNHTISQEQQIFLHAIELADSHAQQEFLAHACEDDDALREKIERLILLHSRKDNLLDLADEVAADINSRVGFETNPISEGMQLGPYKLFQELGDGGMGVVFMAEQTEPVRRKVAIKVIKLGMASRSVVSRFESACQALAMMDHPNITKLHDTGVTEEGRAGAFGSYRFLPNRIVSIAFWHHEV